MPDNTDATTPQQRPGRIACDLANLVLTVMQRHVDDAAPLKAQALLDECMAEIGVDDTLIAERPQVAAATFLALSQTVIALINPTGLDPRARDTLRGAAMLAGMLTPPKPPGGTEPAT